MTDLASLLAAKRDGMRRKKLNQRRERLGKVSLLDTVEEVTSADFAHDFVLDLNRMLDARGARLFAIWQGNIGQVYAALVDQPPEVIFHVHYKKPVPRACFEGEIGSRVQTLMRKHNISAVAGFRGGEFHLQFGNEDVSDYWCLSIVSCRKGERTQYAYKTTKGEG